MPETQPELQEINFNYTANLPELLAENQLSIIFSTYQAGKVVSVGSHQGKLEIRFHQFDRPMGLARTSKGLVIGTSNQVWFLDAVPGLATTIEPANTYDLALVATRSHYTGPIMGHEIAECQGKIWLVNTLFSCLSTLNEGHHFTPEWQPPFISDLAVGDRCHLNGMAVDQTGPRFVTALGETNSPNCWRENKAQGGVLIDVTRNEVLARELCMPHSPRWHQQRLFFLNSGLGELSTIDLGTGNITPITRVPGYTRGMDCWGRYAVVGLSRIRETNVFGGLPIAEQRDQLVSGIAVVDLQSGEPVARLTFHSGVDEIFEAKFLPGYQMPLISGVDVNNDGTQQIWLVPVAK
ncbi:MAG: TIGR03032 family protein [Zavarzinella sp.]